MFGNKAFKLKEFIGMQFLLMLIGAVIFTIIGWQSALSYLLGAFVMYVGNLILLSRFIFSGNKLFSASKELILFYLCEILKLLVIAFASAWLAWHLNINIWMYCLGLFILQVAMWLMPFFIK